jgi:hypothetical protein
MNFTVKYYRNGNVLEEYRLDDMSIYVKKKDIGML